MRTTPMKTLVLCFITSQVMVSCQKEVVNNNTATADDVDEMQLLERRGCHNNRCMVTRTGDDLIYMTPNIMYNKYGDPASVQFDQSPVTVQGTYDKAGRLRLVYFTNSFSHEEFMYKYRSSRNPESIRYYTSNYADYGMPDSLNSTMYFKYDQHGNIIQYRQVNHWYEGYNYTLDIDYNRRGNVKKIVRTPDGGTAFTEYTFETYDNRQNFMNASQWTKFMLLNTGFDPYYALLFSENNAIKWSWQYAPGAPALDFNSKLNYTGRGFANNVFIHLKDSDGSEYGDFTRTSCSTCDNDCGNTTTTLGRKKGNAALQKIFSTNTSFIKGGAAF